jgi:hypothetical protein
MLIISFSTLDSNHYHPYVKHQRSAIEQDVIVIDSDTKDMLDAMNFKDLSGVQVSTESGAQRI